MCTVDWFNEEVTFNFLFYLKCCYSLKNVQEKFYYLFWIKAFLSHPLKPGDAAEGLGPPWTVVPRSLVLVLISHFLTRSQRTIINKSYKIWIKSVWKGILKFSWNELFLKKHNGEYICKLKCIYSKLENRFTVLYRFFKYSSIKNGPIV